MDRFLRTPGWTEMIVESLVGAALVSFAVLNAVGEATKNESLITAGLGAVGGLSIGLALGMWRHRATARRAASPS